MRNHIVARCVRGLGDGHASQLGPAPLLVVRSNRNCNGITLEVFQFPAKPGRGAAGRPHSMSDISFYDEKIQQGLDELQEAVHAAKAAKAGEAQLKVRVGESDRLVEAPHLARRPVDPEQAVRKCQMLEKTINGHFHDYRTELHILESKQAYEEVRRTLAVGGAERHPASRPLRTAETNGLQRNFRRPQARDPSARAEDGAQRAGRRR